MLYRILTVRKHKTITFCDAYSFGGFRQQLAFNNEVLCEIALSPGCVVDIACHSGVNKRGAIVLYVDQIERIIAPEKNNSYKGFQQEDDSSDPTLSSISHELNGGIRLRQFHFKLVFIEKIKELLHSKGIYETNTPIIQTHRGTSIASPIRALGVYTGDKYIKITHELGLKMQSYLSLAPLYEIGYVARDRYKTKSGLNEFLTLEAVLPCDIQFDLSEFYSSVLKLAVQIATDFGIEYSSLFNMVKIIDLKVEYSKLHLPFTKQNYLALYETTIADNRHCIIINAPLDSPLGISDNNNIVMETKWVLDKHGLGHGYKDEYRPQIIRQAFLQQQIQLKNEGVDADLPEDYLKVLEYAGIPTFSFNLGLERFINCFFGELLD